MDQTRHPKAAVTVPTAGNSVTLYQDSDGTVVQSGYPPPAYSGVRVAFYLDQPVTLSFLWGPTLDTADADMETLATETAAASVWNGFVIGLQPGRNKIILTAGATAPTAGSKVAVELSDWPNFALSGIITAVS